jgi:hypothetical protein
MKIILMKSLLGFVLSCKCCQKSFVICKSCYRGHCYCSESCREAGYALAKKKARKTYDQSPEAKLDHRDRSQRYRQNLSQKTVTDKGSKNSSLRVSQHLHLHKELQDLPDEGFCIACGKQVWDQRRIYNGGPL